MRLSRTSAIAIAVGAAVLAATVISPALGGPSLRKLVKKEVARQISNATGPQGPQGPQGPSGTAATPPGGTLQAGITLRGAFGPTAAGVSGAGHSAGEGVSFGGYGLAARPQAHVIAVGGSATTECPGSAAAPSAIPGHLCLYLAKQSAITTGDQLIVTDPVTDNGINFNVETGVTTGFGDSKVGTVGFKVVYADGTAASAQASGTWAVTG
jgi:hypothetical protein